MSVIVTEMRKFCRQFTITRFGTARGKNMNPALYEGDLTCNYLGGILSTCEETFKLNKDGSFESKDDVIAHLHLIYTEAFNEFQKKYGYKVTDRATVDKAIKMSENI